MGRAYSTLGEDDTASRIVAEREADVCGRMILKMSVEELRVESEGLL